MSLEERLFNPEFRVVGESLGWIVVDKPAHLLTHPSKPGNPPTLWDGLRGLLAFEIANGARLSVITRLDRETSGLVLVALHGEAARELSRAMQGGAIGKVYRAVVLGWPERDQWEVDEPILRRGEVETSPIWLKQTVHPGGKASRTRFEVERRVRHPGVGEERFALVRCEPVTGRMHQIRVHLAHAGHPVVGDKIYGRDESCYLRFIAEGWTEALRRELHLDRHALHAMELTYGGERWCSGLPSDISRFLEAGIGS